MASYHRVLESFDRYVTDNDVLCDYDVHPWHVKINQRRWSGKIRLIGFVNCFFLICYTGTSRFEKGIIIYKDPDDLEDIRLRSEGKSKLADKDRGLWKDSRKLRKDQKKKDAEDADTGTPATPKSPTTPRSPTSPDKNSQKSIILEPVTGLESMDSKDPSYFDTDSMVFKITAEGHEIGLQMKYPASTIRRYEIELVKHGDPLQRRRTMLALKRHDTLDLLVDAISVGIISGWEVTGHALGHVSGGGVIEGATKKFMTGINAQSRTQGMMLSGDD